MNFTGPAYSKRYRAPKPLARFAHKVKGGRKATELYSDLHDAWRAGVIADFYYGTEYDDGPLIWQVRARGHGMCVFEAKNLDGVRREVESALEEAGIESIEVGPAWCGYPSMTVTYSDGSVLVDSYNGRERVESLNGRSIAVKTETPAPRNYRREVFPELNGLAAF